MRATIIIRCNNCEKIFSPRHLNERYCSPKCKYKAMKSSKKMYDKNKYKSYRIQREKNELERLKKMIKNKSLSYSPETLETIRMAIKNSEEKIIKLNK